MSLTDILDKLDILAPVLHKLTMSLINDNKKIKNLLVLNYDAYKLISSLYYFYYTFSVHIVELVASLVYLSASVLLDKSSNFSLILGADIIITLFAVHYIKNNYKSDIFYEKKKMRIKDMKLLYAWHGILIITLVLVQQLLVIYYEGLYDISFEKGYEFSIIIYILVGIFILLIYLEAVNLFLKIIVNNINKKIDSYKNYEPNARLIIDNQTINIDQKENILVITPDNKIHIKEQNKELFNTDEIKLKGSNKLIVRELGKTKDIKITHNKIAQYFNK